MAFLPDGRFVAANTPEFGGRSEDLASNGLVLVDPKARWFPDAPETVWTDAADPSQLTDVTDDPGLANVILTNGARLYVDHAHPEYSSPEVTNPRDAVLWEYEGDMYTLRRLTR